MVNLGSFWLGKTVACEYRARELICSSATLPAQALSA